MAKETVTFSLKVSCLRDIIYLLINGDNLFFKKSCMAKEMVTFSLEVSRLREICIQVCAML